MSALQHLDCRSCAKEQNNTFSSFLIIIFLDLLKYSSSSGFKLCLQALAVRCGNILWQCALAMCNIYTLLFKQRQYQHWHPWSWQGRGIIYKLYHPYHVSINIVIIAGLDTCSRKWWRVLVWMVKIIGIVHTYHYELFIHTILLQTILNKWKHYCWNPVSSGLGYGNCEIYFLY